MFVSYTRLVLTLGLLRLTLSCLASMTKHASQSTDAATNVSWVPPPQTAQEVPAARWSEFFREYHRRRYQRNYFSKYYACKHAGHIHCDTPEVSTGRAATPPAAPSASSTAPPLTSTSAPAPVPTKSPWQCTEGCLEQRRLLKESLLEMFNMDVSDEDLDELMRIRFKEQLQLAAMEPPIDLSSLAASTQVIDDDLVGAGFVVRDGFLGHEAVVELKKEVEHMKLNGMLGAGTTGYGSFSSLRGDIQLAINLHRLELRANADNDKNAYSTEQLACDRLPADLRAVLNVVFELRDQRGIEYQPQVSNGFFVPGGKTVLRCLLRRLYLFAKQELTAVAPVRSSPSARVGADPVGPMTGAEKNTVKSLRQGLVASVEAFYLARARASATDQELASASVSAGKPARPARKSMLGCPPGYLGRGFDEIDDHCSVPTAAATAPSNRVPAEAADGPSAVFAVESATPSVCLSLEDSEFIVAHFPGNGTRYYPHIDQSFMYSKNAEQREGPKRMFSVMYYLNPSWDEANGGGELRLHVDGNGDKYVDIAPIGDRLVVFPSQFMAHEVMPAKHDRYAVVGWFKAKPC